MRQVPWIAPLVAVALAQLAAIATSVYLHRALAHRALRLHPITDVCFRLLLWLTTGQDRRQNFANTAYNSRVLAWVTAGESLHNNHHAYPRAPRFSMGRLEFDPSWVVIRMLAAVRLVEIVGASVRIDGPSARRTS